MPDEPDFYWQAGDPITPEMRAILGDDFADYLASVPAEPGQEQSMIVERTGPPDKRTFIQFVDRPMEAPDA